MDATGGSVSEWRPGQVILDLYEVLGVVRTGGMGLVYRVRHPGWDVELALKVPRTELIGSPETAGDFAAEAETWVGLGLHPHTVHCAYVRSLGGIPCVFAEWVDGGSVAEAVRGGALYRNGPGAALRGALDIAIQTAWGLDHAHRRGLVHQDVKPANVMLTRDGTAKVTDFGLASARAAAGEDATALPGAGPTVTVAGLTPAYCSPEQALAAHGSAVRLSRATDVWSWAVSVWELFAGYPPTPYGHAAAEAFEDFVARGGPTGAEPGLPVLPAGLVAALRGCLRRDPGERPDRMGELADVLVDVYRRETGLPYPRERPVEAALLADGLSNQALSMLDLGRPERAEALWEEALRADPHHPPTVYNRGLHRWREGRTTDTAVLAELRETRAGWTTDWLTGLLHIERGDPDAAFAALREAARAAPGEPSVTAAVALADRLPAVRPPVVLEGHTTWVECVALTPDGRLVASAGRDSTSPAPPGSEGGTVRVWDPARQRPLCVLPGHHQGTTALALSPDGRWVAAGDPDGTVLVGDIRTGRPAHRLTGHAERVEALAFSPDGGLLATASADGAVLLWETPRGRPLHTLERGTHPAGTYDGALAFAPDGRHVLRWETATNRLRMWDARTGHLVRSRQRRSEANVVFSADGGTLLMSPYDGPTEVRESVTGRRIRILDWAPGPGARLTVDAHGRRALATHAEWDGVKLWDLVEGRCLRTLGGQPDAALAVALGGDGRTGVSGGSDRAVRVWELAPPGPRMAWGHVRPRPAVELIREADVVVRAREQAVRLVARGRPAAAADELRAALRVPGFENHPGLLDEWAAVGAHGRRDGLLKARRGREIDEADDAAALSPDGRLVLVGGHDPRLWEARGEQPPRRLQGHLAQVNDVAFTPDGGRAVTASEDGTLRVWDLADGGCRHVLRGHPAGVRTVTVSPDGRFAVSTDEQWELRVWDLAGGGCRHTLGQGRKPRRIGVYDRVPVAAVGGRTALSADADGWFRAWDLDSGRPLPHRLMEHAGDGGHLALSADGRVALVCAYSMLCGWDLAKGRANHPLRSAATGRITLDRATSLGLTPDGGTAYAADEKGALRVWDMRRGHCRHEWTGLGVSWALATDDGRFLISSGVDGTLRVWDLADGRCLRELDGRVRYLRPRALSTDARTLLCSGDGGLRVWEFDWDYDLGRR
ncbi:protein kinase domain-containing protein [Streptomyces sp. WM6386]|uniref:protein kinase domain-containing protein n=1 Tax=Streptomyces sp. WM6386 TaxID=1415558 RepID=UPI000619104D|nr:protein kinase [Streptomyces sp. WM6386]KKD03738.1 hypothetical protein TN53_33595 [Streptomyces sp. WM6386]